nr:hypothetical protein [Tanacetum cinerariifolium]
ENVEDKILVPKLPKNYARCGHLIDGPYCQGCTLLRKKLEEDLDHGVNSSQNPPHVDECCCECGDALDGIFCQQCTCKSCGKAPCVSKPNFIDEYSNVFNPPPQPPIYSCEFCESNAQYGHYCTPQVPFINPEPAEYINTPGWNRPAFYNDDDDEESSNSLEDNIIYELPLLPEKIYSNPLFDEEIIPMKIDPHSFNAESDLIESMPHHDSSIIISSKIDSLFDEFAGELTLLKSIPSGINETGCHPEEENHFTKRLLYDNSSPRPPEEFVFENSNADIESFSPFPIPVEDSDSLIEEIDLSYTPDDPMSSSIEDDDDDSERDILIHEEFLDNYSLLLPVNDSFHFDIPLFSRPPAKPPDGNTRILNIKMMGDNSDQKVPIPNLMITLVSNQEKSSMT